ncbi:TMhelix containing protein [Vibrio phage 1.204.O._10N.222.46.F12]|uniref:TMhelix containing protein n=1 Tax=Vibrio phage 1.204.O._10N.222.46.F12 TaxID=1881263 RepID=A0A2I7RNK4_9CAUD|nr:TMhelix containing protein [Vibrio phage 1.204.O._10N.222.46.F12]AUR95225.1 TMhelix containing protein [Vibrio phage 1.204.O._10N.222.46.F12]
MVKVWLLVVCLALSGCAGLTGTALEAGLGAVGLGDKGNGLQVDTELVNGDKQQQVQLGEALTVSPKFDEVDLENSTMNVNTDTTQKQREINASSVEYKEGVAYWQAALAGMIFLLLGLFTPQYVVRRK